MIGFKQNFAIKSTAFVVTFFVFASGARANVPYPAQIFRFQPALIKTETAFSSDGKVNVAGASIKTDLRWYGPGNYDLTLLDVPSRFHKLENQSGAWVLRRQGSNCTIRGYGITASCGQARAWALMEFSSDVQQIANALVKEGFYSREDTAWVESDARQSVPAHVNRTRLALGSNGNRPVAALEVLGVNSDGGMFSGAGDSQALVQFDQTFLKPIHVRFRENGENFVINGQADLEVKKGKPRFSYILANHVQVLRASTEVAAFSRSEPKALVKTTKSPEPVQSIAGIDAFETQLSLSGKTLLQALLLTH